MGKFKPENIIYTPQEGEFDLREGRTLEATCYRPLSRVLLAISYDGSEYGGWQIQPNRLAVQEDMQNKLTKLYGGQFIHLIGSSRTDAGVHAIGFAASFLTPVRPVIPLDKLQTALNRQLPPAIRVRSVREVPLDFHTRYDAIGKAYTYVMNLGLETPFSGRYSMLTSPRLDVEAMRQTALQLTGTHDYSSFVAERKNIDDAVRTIYDIRIQDFDNFRCITFIGNGFLYKMVRNLVGTLEAAGRHKITPAEARSILEARDRTLAPETAPAHGLFLMKVFFEPDDPQSFELKQVPFFM
ncbi:MAG: tRNA pseudouridine(38-40) synthase TruA [Lentisphaerae bacterium]|nr:tRNA pseudouridine(38-40) synthase TruA [Lentisphaerota bacterium]